MYLVHVYILEREAETERVIMAAASASVIAKEFVTDGHVYR